ncbi:unnamed protein product [Sphenostylis stenocarpa]|uniref:Photosynthesis system II assembly factor Ycf48/Hcf136-like domain-containing protein n=1 Tax=Sphenostylis stenocarpa TaxID=92480 RepID=A0AA86SEL0_9FABA|nr:unnamed protein product [Sphenostylis stenocarpa]
MLPATDISLSAELPGDMVYIKATGEKSAEMVTDEGVIYITANRGYNWRAAVQETVSATLNRSMVFKHITYPCLAFIAVEREVWDQMDSLLL